MVLELDIQGEEPVEVCIYKFATRVRDTGTKMARI